MITFNVQPATFYVQRATLNVQRAVCGGRRCVSLPPSAYSLFLGARHEGPDPGNVDLVDGNRAKLRLREKRPEI